jgi:hypothetical protein
MDYTADFTGSKEVTAEVIDSVLYDGTDSATINSSGGGGVTSPLTFTEADRTGSKTKYSWSGGTGPYTVKLTSGGVVQCTSTGTSCEGVLLPVGTSVTLQDSTGTTRTMTVTN